MNFINHLYNIFVDGNGYLLLLKGLGVTLKVAFFACLLGILLGLIAAIMKMTEVRKGRKTIFSIIANIYIDVIRGTPTVVQLLIIYFLVFRSQASTLAGICTFGINSGAYVAEIIRAGIMAVDKGQMEAGRSLGLSYGTTMKEIIIPQAIKNILPALGNELIVLTKETAILGYVGIMDLAKASDFIISRKYVMFEPLIAIAIIYYIVVKLMTLALNAFERRLRQSDIR
ncbi:MAG: amino acid ABC transporter permease [Lachnospiraceae bacterium]|nr:amino acid ABC transporter permease [Lachnospiraceae bacterium]